MAFTSRFRRGVNVVDLNSGGYGVDKDAIPPSIQLENNIAVGPFGNRNGGVLIGQKPLDRQFQFTVKVRSGSTAQSAMLARNLASFISAQSSEPLFYEYKDNTRPEPLWGTFDQALRYEVVTAQAAIGQNYSETAGSLGFDVQISLEVKPYAVGKTMRAGSAAYSGIGIEDYIGTLDGASRGGKFGASTTTNLVSNYDFSNATWNSGWTAGANILETQNTDKRFVFPGKTSSARLFSKNTVTNTYLNSITAANTNTHSFSAYVHQAEGTGAVTSSDMVLQYNGSNLSTTFVSLGNGWYWARATAAGVAAPHTFGIVLLNGKSIYLAAVKAEEYAFPLPLEVSAFSMVIYPVDDIDTEFGGRLQIAGSVSVIWKADHASNTLDSQRHFVDAGGTSGLWFDGADDKIYGYDGTNTISSAAQTFSPGDILHLDFTWGPTGLNIYKNGANIATGATYTPPTAPTSIVIGGSAFNAYTYGTYMDCGIYDQELTSAQVLARYQAASTISAQDKIVGYIPWAAGQVTSLVNHEDSASHYNRIHANGIPGTAPAKTRLVVTPNTVNLAGYWLLHNASDFFVAPLGQEYKDLSGTAEAGTTSGDARLDIATVGAVTTTTGLTWTVTRSDFISGKVHFFCRAMHQTGTGTFTLAPVVSYAAGNNIIGTEKAVVLTTAWKWWYVGNMDVTIPSIVPSNKRSITFGLQLKSSSGADTQARFDYIMAVPNSAVRLKSTLSAGWTSFVYEGNSALELNSNGQPMQFMGVTGDVIELVPGKANLVWVVQSDHGEANAITPTATVLTYITPRWSLL